jgi:hypothetical protein
VGLVAFIGDGLLLLLLLFHFVVHANTSAPTFAPSFRGTGKQVCSDFTPFILHCQGLPGLDVSLVYIVEFIPVFFNIRFVQRYLYTRTPVFILY